MNIFASLYEEIPPLKEYLNYHFEEKEGNVIGSHKQHDCVFAIEEAMAELFYPQKNGDPPDNRVLLQASSRGGNTITCRVN
jgi:hypothetical protein